MVPRPYSMNERVAHAVTHGVAAVASIVGLVVLVAQASVVATPLHVMAVAIFGGSMVLLYTASTLYHSIPIPAAEPILHMLDHAAIYVLIAGSYTPFALITLGGEQGWWLFALVWTLAVAGVVFKLFYTGRFNGLSTALYLAMGWMGVFYASDVIDALPGGGLALLAGGGIAYSVGAGFYLYERLHYNHTIWHVFVMLGTTLHYFSILLYVIPATAG